MGLLAPLGHGLGICWQGIPGKPGSGWRKGQWSKADYLSSEEAHPAGQKHTGACITEEENSELLKTAHANSYVEMENEKQMGLLSNYNSFPPCEV